MRNVTLRTHDESRCRGQYCCIHNPSDHHMRDWPLNWRQDLNVMERTCPHGVGHPDPDDAAHKIRMGQPELTSHGCDGCCNPGRQAAWMKRLKAGDRIRAAKHGLHWYWTVRERQERGVVVTAMNGNGHLHLKEWEELERDGYYDINKRECGPCYEEGGIQ